MKFLKKYQKSKKKNFAISATVSRTFARVKRQPCFLRKNICANFVWKIMSGMWLMKISGIFWNTCKICKINPPLVLKHLCWDKNPPFRVVKKQKRRNFAPLYIIWIINAFCADNYLICVPFACFFFNVRNFHLC